MCTSLEETVKRLVVKYQGHLVERGVEIISRGAETLQHGKPQGVALYKQLLEGCLLTMLYDRYHGHQLVVLDWSFVDPTNN